MRIGYVGMVVLLCCGLAVCCPTSYDLDYSSCVFYINYADAACFNFTLTSCTYQYCDYYVQVGNDSQCHQYLTATLYSWGECTAYCCDSSVTYLQDTAAINQCQDYLNQQAKLAGIIIGSVLGGVAFIAIFVICIFNRCEPVRRLSNFSAFCNGFVLRCIRGVFRAQPIQENVQAVAMQGVTRISDETVMAVALA